MADSGNTEQKQVIVSIKGDNSQLNEAISDSKEKLQDLGKAEIPTKSVSDLKNEVKSLAQELGEAEDKAYALQKAGKFDTTEYRDAIKDVAKLHQEQNKFNSAVEAFNPANKLGAFVGVAQGASIAVQGVAGAMQFMGVNSDSALQSIAKLQALMAFSDALGGIDNIKNSFKGLGLLIKGIIPSMEGASIATKGFGIALDAIGIGLITAAIAYLISNFKEIKEYVSGLIPGLGSLGNTFNKFKSIVVGIGGAFVQYLIGPLKAAIDLIHGDFKKAIDDAKQGFNVVSNFKKSYDNSQLAQQKEANQKLAAEQVKSLTNQLALQKEGSKQYIAIQNRLADAKIAAAKDDDERNKAVQDKAVLYAQRRFKAEDDAAQKAKAAAQKREQERIQKEKATDDAIKAAWDKYVEDRKASQDTLTAYIDAENKAARQKGMTDAEKAIDDENEKYKALLASAIKYNLNTEDLEKAHQQALIDIKAKGAQAANIKNLGSVSDKAQGNLISTQSNDSANDKDSPEVAKQKIFEISAAQIDAENAAFALKKAQTIAQNGDLEAIEAQHQAALVSIQKDRADKTKAIDKATLDAKLTTYGAIGSALGALGQLAGQQTVAGKALGVAEALINTYVGATKALAQGGIAGIAGAVAVIAAGIASVKQILSVKVDAPGDTSSSQNTNAPRIDLSNVSAPTITASNQQQQVQDVRITNHQEQPPIQAYITDKQLKDSQDRTALYNKLSTI